MAVRLRRWSGKSGGRRGRLASISARTLVRAQLTRFGLDTDRRPGGRPPLQVRLTARRRRVWLGRWRLDDRRHVWFVDGGGLGARYDQNGWTRHLRFRRSDWRRVSRRIDLPGGLLRMQQQYDGRCRGGRRCEHDRGEDESVGSSRRPAGFAVGLDDGWRVGVISNLVCPNAIQWLEQVVKLASGVLPQHGAMVQRLIDVCVRFVSEQICKCVYDVRML